MINDDNKEEMELKEDLEIEKMMEAGLHFGHKKTKRHPKMEPFIYGVRNGVSVIDVSKTKQMLKEALDFLFDSISQGKTLLLVGTKVQIKGTVKETGEECEIPYINERWLGGTITNFDIIKKRIDYLKELEKKKEEGDLEKYTKKERIKIDREIKALKIKFEGLKGLSRVPDIIFILDTVHDDLAVKEARDKKIKIIGIVDTNADPDIIDYPIPANDDALSSVKYILEKFKTTILEAKKNEQKKDDNQESVDNE